MAGYNRRPRGGTRHKNPLEPQGAALFLLQNGCKSEHCFHDQPLPRDYVGAPHSGLLQAEKSGILEKSLDKAPKRGRIPKTAVKIKERRNKWMGKNSKPEKAGWYYVRHLDGSLSSRYFDDSQGGSWWNATAWDGFTPNDSFVEWLLVHEVHLQIQH